MPVSFPGFCPVTSAVVTLTKELSNKVTDPTSHDSRGHVDANVAAEKLQRLVRPSPVPDLLDACIGPVKGKIPHCVLLVAESCAVFPAMEDQVRDHPPTAFFHEDASVDVPLSRRQPECAVLNQRRLGRWPVDCGRISLNVSRVEDEITNLAEEDIGRLEVELCFPNRVSRAPASTVRPGTTYSHCSDTDRHPEEQWH